MFDNIGAPSYVKDVGQRGVVMSQYEKYAWLSLIAWALILAFVLTRTTAGLDSVIAQFGPGVQQPQALTLLGNYVFIGILAAAAEVGIQLSLILPRGGSALEKDERDRIIDTRAHLTSYWFTVSALNIVFMYAVITAAFGGQASWLVDMPVITSVAFALLVVMVGAEVLQRAALVLQYRLG
jgi:hypothetical protein